MVPCHARFEVPLLWHLSKAWHSESFSEPRRGVQPGNSGCTPVRSNDVWAFAILYYFDRKGEISLINNEIFLAVPPRRKDGKRARRGGTK